MADRIRGIPLGQVFPGGTSAQHPQDAVQHCTEVMSGSSPPPLPSLYGNQRLDSRPLFIRQIHRAHLAEVNQHV